MKADIYDSDGAAVEVDVLAFCFVTITEPLCDDDTKQQRSAKKARAQMATFDLHGVRSLIAVLKAAEDEMMHE